MRKATGHRRLAVVAVLAIAGCGAPAASQPPPSPTVTCQGVPAERCDEAVAAVARSLPKTAPVAIEVICVAGTCSRDAGAMDTVVTLPDGSQLRSATTSWNSQRAPFGDTPAPMPVEPVLPVQPVCQGVPAGMCLTMAETAFGELSDDGVVQIVVRCTEVPCTDDHGVGDTRITYADGETRTSSWEYAGG